LQRLVQVEAVGGDEVFDGGSGLGSHGAVDDYAATIASSVKARAAGRY
jgi:hypothetical protein